MLVTVIKDSVIYNGNIYSKGQAIEVNDAVGKSLIERGYVEEVHEAEVLTGHLDENQLSEMSYQDLRALASQMGLSAKGTKEELIDRISATEVNVDADAVEDEDSDDEAPADGDMPDTSMPE